MKQYINNYGWTIDYCGYRIYDNNLINSVSEHIPGIQTNVQEAVYGMTISSFLVRQVAHEFMSNYSHVSIELALPTRCLMQGLEDIRTFALRPRYNKSAYMLTVWDGFGWDFGKCCIVVIDGNQTRPISWNIIEVYFRIHVIFRFKPNGYVDIS